MAAMAWSCRSTSAPTGSGRSTPISRRASAEEIAATLRDRLGSGCFGAPLTVEALPETDWVARGLEGAEAGRRRPVPRPRQPRSRQSRAGRIAIEIDAGQAFGTGHHATTAGCLAVLDRLMRGAPLSKRARSRDRLRRARHRDGEGAAAAGARHRHRSGGGAGRGGKCGAERRRATWSATVAAAGVSRTRPSASARPSIWSSPTSWPSRSAGSRRSLRRSSRAGGALVLSGAAAAPARARRRRLWRARHAARDGAQFSMAGRCSCFDEP